MSSSASGSSTPSVVKIGTISPGIAPEYSSYLTYSKGDYVLYDNGYWVCSEAILTPEPWNAARWVLVPNVLLETVRHRAFADVADDLDPQDGSIEETINKLNQILRILKGDSASSTRED